MTINKRYLQFLGAVLILVFHYWARFTNSVIERFAVSVCYIGVDLFFICSAYSLSRKKHIEYFSFVKNRFKNIYLKFIVFALIYSLFIYKPSVANSAPFYLVRLNNFLSIITGYELFKKGGGAFLWFVPAIMLFYLIFPLFINWKFKYKDVAALLLYVLTAIIFQNLGLRQLFIVLNRIPVTLLTYILVKKGHKLDYRHGLLLAGIGIVLMYLYSFKMRLNTPFYDSYYLVAIPLVIGISLMSKDFRLTAFAKKIADASLEIYAIQMMYGMKLLKLIMKYSKDPIAVNIFLFVSIILIGIAVNKVFTYLFNLKLKKA